MRPRHCEYAEAGGIENLHRIAQDFEPVVKHEAEQPGDQRDRQRVPGGKRLGRDRADQHITHDPTRNGGDESEHQNAEQIHLAPRPEHRAAEREDESADQVERPNQQRGGEDVVHVRTV